MIEGVFFFFVFFFVLTTGARSCSAKRNQKSSEPQLPALPDTANIHVALRSYTRQVLP